MNRLPGSALAYAEYIRLSTLVESIPTTRGTTSLRVKIPLEGSGLHTRCFISDELSEYSLNLKDFGPKLDAVIAR